MRRMAKVDRNQAEVVEALRKAGWHVAITSSLGDGFPDLVVSKGGWMAYVEVKDGAKPPSERELTEDQVKFRRACKGPYYVVSDTLKGLQMLENARIWRP